MNQTDLRDSKDDLGRRLLAALMSYQLRLKSIDYTMKNYVGKNEIDPSWGELAWALLEILNRDQGEKLLPPFLKALTDSVQ